MDSFHRKKTNTNNAYDMNKFFEDVSKKFRKNNISNHQVVLLKYRRLKQMWNCNKDGIYLISYKVRIINHYLLVITKKLYAAVSCGNFEKKKLCKFHFMKGTDINTNKSYGNQDDYEKG